VENCNGTDKTCGEDTFQSAGFVCRSAANSCDPTEQCVGGTASCPPNVPNDPTLPGCAVSNICRTPGFYGNHPNIVAQLLAAGGGSITICGEEPLTSTFAGSDVSVIEAICIGGSGREHLARDLATMALNCKLSNGPLNCDGTIWDTIFDTCNLACANNTAQVGQCQGTVDCLNNGGVPSPNGQFCGSGVCSDNGLACTPGNLTLCANNPVPATCIPAPNCHNADLPNPFNPPGSADPNECKKARKSSTTIFSL
jgi:hypothetical protein